VPAKSVSAPAENGLRRFWRRFVRRPRAARRSRPASTRLTAGNGGNQLDLLAKFGQRAPAFPCHPPEQLVELTGLAFCRRPEKIIPPLLLQLIIR